MPENTGSARAADARDVWPRLLSQIDDAWPSARWRDLGVVVGCSGGADSVALLTALNQLRNPTAAGQNPPRGFLLAAHFNHGLRGDQSDADEEFVRQLAGQQQIRFVSAAAIATLQDEATLRTQRLAFLTKIAQQSGARYIALAHSLDDNVETVLHHLLRGTGPAGLSGISSHRAIGQDLVLARPLLSIHRDLLRLGLRAIGQGWREDASNNNLDYRRNWIRHRLIPLIQSEYPSAVDAIGRAIDRQRSWRDLIEQLAQDWLATHRHGNGPVRVTRDATTPEPVVVAAAQAIWTQMEWPRGEMNRQHWTRLAATIQSESDQRYALPGKIEVAAQGPNVHLCREKR